MYDAAKHTEILNANNERVGYYITPTMPMGRHKLSLAEFRRRFTLAERVAIESSADPLVITIKKDLEAATYVSLLHAETIAGIDELISAGLIDAARKTAILELVEQ